MFVSRMAVEGNTVVAVDTETQAVLGGFLNEDYSNEVPPGMDHFMSTSDGDWLPCVSMIGELEEAFNATYSMSTVSRVRACVRRVYGGNQYPHAHPSHRCQG